MTSNGACSTVAISYATGTPPRGKPSTTTPGQSRYPASRSASTCPASRRLRNTPSIVHSSARVTCPNGSLRRRRLVVPDEAKAEAMKRLAKHGAHDARHDDEQQD